MHAEFSGVPFIQQECTLHRGGVRRCTSEARSLAEAEGWEDEQQQQLHLFDRLTTL